MLKESAALSEENDTLVEQLDGKKRALEIEHEEVELACQRENVAKLVSAIQSARVTVPPILELGRVTGNWTSQHGEAAINGTEHGAKTSPTTCAGAEQDVSGSSGGCDEAGEG